MRVDKNKGNLKPDERQEVSADAFTGASCVRVDLPNPMGRERIEHIIIFTEKSRVLETLRLAGVCFSGVDLMISLKLNNYKHRS